MKFRSNQNRGPTSNKPERYKLVYDFLKHLTTLSSGSILIILALAEKFIKESASSESLFKSLVCFLLTIVFALVAMFILAKNVDSKEVANGEANAFAVGGLFSFVAFFAGMAYVVTAVMGQYR